MLISILQALEQIAEMYFGIQIARPRNFMADMMSSFFGGPAPGAASSSKRPQVGASKPAVAAPPAVELD